MLSSVHAEQSPVDPGRLVGDQPGDQAGRIEETIARHDRLRAQETAFRNGGSFVRISAFILNFDRPLVQGTIAAYEPAVPVTTGASVGLMSMRNGVVGGNEENSGMINASTLAVSGTSP